jgi:hypothetical protein
MLQSRCPSIEYVARSFFFADNSHGSGKLGRLLDIGHFELANTMLSNELEDMRRMKYCSARLEELCAVRLSLISVSSGSM